MVKGSSIYLFFGQDSFSKDIKLKGIKEEFLTKEIQDFNLDILYGKELNLKDLQEKLLYLPLNPVRNFESTSIKNKISNGVKTQKRLIVIKDAQVLRENTKDFILKYAKHPNPNVLLILDINRYDPKDEFIRRIINYTRVFRFREPPHLNTFTLSRSIQLKNVDYSLRVLNQLLKNGEKPERILGGLRYAYERDAPRPFTSIRKRLKLLLNCDLDIKMGRLNLKFALERLVVKLCAL